MPTRLALAVFILTSLVGPVHAEQPSTINLAENSAEENTNQNERDKGNTTLTPEDQNLSPNLTSTSRLTSVKPFTKTKAYRQMPITSKLLAVMAW